MNSTRTVPVTPALISEALEHYWRSIAMIKDNEEVKLWLKNAGVFAKTDIIMEATITSTKEVVETFRL